MKLLRLTTALVLFGGVLFGGRGDASPVPTCAEFLTLEQFHLQQVRVSPETGQIMYAQNASVPQLARYMIVFGWMQGQIEADAWFANGQNQQVGLQTVKIEGTTYDHMTWAFAFCRGYPTARMPLVADEVFNFFTKK
ncbi:MAG TPA: hypothetical protein VKT99_20730 [Xanthobacteraceae bacterium]|jgi:hypothetical protein|nr:hypothetical protein [Xanthobacteraceae bacterium]